MGGQPAVSPVEEDHVLDARAVEPCGQRAVRAAVADQDDGPVESKPGAVAHLVEQRLDRRVDALIDHVDLANSLLHGMLGLLLFAGALHVDLGELRELRGPIAALALAGTAISTVVVGVSAYCLFDTFGGD